MANIYLENERNASADIYKAALQKFKDFHYEIDTPLIAIIEPSENETVIPDLTLFRWDQIDSVNSTGEYTDI